MPRKLTIKQFKERAIIIHGKKYLYHESEYINAKTKIKIYCIKCKEFFYQLPLAHLNGFGCNLKIKYTTESFIKKAKEIHNNNYSYHLVDYKHSSKEIDIFCNNCLQIFKMKPIQHIRKIKNKRGSGCTNCQSRGGKVWSYTSEEYIKMAKSIWSDIYDYSLVKYISSTCKITIICKIHGLFQLCASRHISKKRAPSGCKKCATEKLAKNLQLKYSWSFEDFINEANKIHKFKFDYSLSKYINLKEKIQIICKKHNLIFNQTPAGHLNTKHCCPMCSSEVSINSSKLEKEWLDSLNIPDDSFHRAVRIFVNENKFYITDGYMPESNSIFEYHGNFFHGNPDFYNQDDINPVTKTTFGHLYQKTLQKEADLRNAGFNVISMWEN